MILKLVQDRIPEAKLGSSAYGAPRQFQLTDFDTTKEWELLGGGRENSLSFVMGPTLKEILPNSNDRSIGNNTGRKQSADENRKEGSFIFSLFGSINKDKSGAKVSSSSSPHRSQDIESPNPNDDVTQGNSNHKNVTFALKIFNKAKLVGVDGDTTVALDVMRSMRILKELSEVNSENICIVQFFGTLGTKDQICYVLEPLLYGNLRRVLNIMHGPESFNLKMPHIRFYAACLAKAVDFMRRYGIAHRDIRPENILFDSNGIPKLIDFSVCKQYPYFSFKADSSMSKSFTFVGQIDYCAPELFLPDGHNTGVDLWALGIVFYEMYMGSYKTPFRHVKNENGFLTGNLADFAKIDIVRLKERIIRTAETGVILPYAADFQTQPLGTRLFDLISKLLVFEPTSRYPFCSNNFMSTSVFDHPFFADDCEDTELGDGYNKSNIANYEPAFKPRRFKRIVRGEFRNESLFTRYRGDQRVFVGFR